jgi:hypothetical protein
MFRLRASMAMMLTVVGLTAVGFAALRVSSRLWACVCVSSAILALVVSIAGIIYRRGSTRAFWVGFALFGWTYLIVSLGPAPLNAWRELLVTAPILSILEDQMLDVPTPTMRPPPSATLTPAARRSLTFTELTPWVYWTDTDRSNPFASDSFSRIGHALFCLMIAMGGGVFCRALHDTQSPSSPSP